jgi:hypothetical protein
MDAFETEEKGVKRKAMAKPEYVEGTEAVVRFHAAMRRVISVPDTEIQRRVEAERKASVGNPNRCGPKPKERAATRYLQ